MKKIKLIGVNVLTLFFVIALMAFSCEKEETFTHYQNFLSAKKILTYTQKQLTRLLVFLSDEYPDLGQMEVNSDVVLYKIKYRTTFNGKDIIASGLVLVPDIDKTLSIILFQNGTNTCHKNAPSKNGGSFYYSLISSMASYGYVVAIADYIGFGESDSFLHPYLHRTSSDIVIKDMLQATSEFTKNLEISSNISNNIFLMGYSQGGWASLSVLNYLENYPVEFFKPVAVNCGAGAYNLTGMAKYIVESDEYPNPFYIPYFIESRRANGILNDKLGKYFQEPYATEIPKMFYGDKCNGELSKNLPQKVSNLMTTDLMDNFNTSADFESLRNELAINSIEPWKTSTKLRFFHCTGDKSVPYEQSKDIYTTFRQSASDTDLSINILDNDSLDHNDAIIFWGIDAINWINAIQSN